MNYTLIGTIVTIVVIVLFVVGLAVLYKTGHKELVKKIILALVDQAETNLGSGTGAIKYLDVSQKVYEILPPLLKLVFTPKEIDTYIEEGVAELKSVLAKADSTSTVTSTSESTDSAK